MTRSSKRLTEAGNRINQTFGGRHFKTILDRNTYIFNAYKYNYRNPVSAGIVTRVECYPYSTLHGLLGFGKLLVPVVEDSILFDDLDGTINWLNRDPGVEKMNAVQIALTRSYFKSPKNNETRKCVIAPDEVI